MTVADIGWEELVFWEIKAREYLTRIICGIIAFFLRNAEIVRMNQKLNITFYLNNREKSQRNGNA